MKTTTWADTAKLIRELWPNKAEFTAAERDVWKQRLAYQDQATVRKALRSYKAEKNRKTPVLSEVLYYVKQVQPATYHGQAADPAKFPPRQQMLDDIAILPHDIREHHRLAHFHQRPELRAFAGNHEADPAGWGDWMLRLAWESTKITREDLSHSQPTTQRRIIPDGIGVAS